MRRLYSLLYRHFGPQHWWPAGSAWEMMVGAILTQNTAWANVEKAIAALKQAQALSANAIAQMPRRRLERLIRPSGYFRQKAERLQEFAREMIRDRKFYRVLCGNAGADLRVRPQSSISGRHGGLPLQEMREQLLSFHGIGPETADSILLYAARQPVFVVDAYTRRIGQRLGLFKTNDYDQIQHIFESALRPSPLPSPLTEGRGTRAARGEGSRHLVKLYNEFHALIVRLAKEICTKRDPRCSICPVKPDCAYGRRSS